MKTKFRTYCGLAGDLQELLTAENENGLEECILITRTGLFRYYRMRRAKKKLLQRLELRTGKKHKEQY